MMTPGHLRGGPRRPSPLRNVLALGYGSPPSSPLSPRHPPKPTYHPAPPPPSTSSLPGPGSPHPLARSPRSPAAERRSTLATRGSWRPAPLPRVQSLALTPAADEAVRRASPSSVRIPKDPSEPAGDPQLPARPGMMPGTILPKNWRQLVGGSQARAKFMWHALVPATRSAYESAVMSYSAFARAQGVKGPLFPAAADMVADWIASEAVRLGLRPGRPTIGRGTLEARVQGLISWHTDLNLDPAGCRAPVVRRTIRGAKKLIGVKPVRPAPPITRPILFDMLGAIARRPQDYGGTLAATGLVTAFVVAFACFLRSGEFTHTNFDPRFNLSRSCVVWPKTPGEPVKLRIPASKTDPFGETVLVVVPRDGGPRCPVRLLRVWLDVSPLQEPNDPLFWMPGGGFPKTRVVQLMRRALLDAGIPDPSSYSGHSFRRGAATWAASVGVPESQIQLLGRWASLSVRRYTDVPAAQVARVSEDAFSAPLSLSRLPASGIAPPDAVWVPRS